MKDETRLVPAQVPSALAAETIPFAPVTVAVLTTKMIAAIDLIAALIPDLRKPHPDTKNRSAAPQRSPRSDRGDQRIEMLRAQSRTPSRRGGPSSSRRR